MPTYTGSLTPDGPIVTLAFGVSDSERQRLQHARLPVPPPFQVRVLVDSGSPFTLADLQLIPTLQVQQYTMQPVLGSASGLSTNYLPVFDLSVALLDDTGHRVWYWPGVRVLGTSYPANSIQGLFGRDLLDDCVFTYDGKRRTFTLDI